MEAGQPDRGRLTHSATPRPDKRCSIEQTVQDNLQEPDVIDTELPADRRQRVDPGFAACLASVTEVPVTELPLPDTDLAHALGAWRTWLAGHGSGLVPVADPTRFQWAGWWIAVVENRGPSPRPRHRRRTRRWRSWHSAHRRGSCSAHSPQPYSAAPPPTCRSPGAYAVASLDPVFRPALGRAGIGRQRRRAGHRARGRGPHAADGHRNRPTLAAGLRVTATPPVPEPSVPAPYVGRLRPDPHRRQSSR